MCCINNEDQLMFIISVFVLCYTKNVQLNQQSYRITRMSIF